MRRLGAAATLCLTLGLVGGCGGSSDPGKSADAKGSTGGSAGAVATAGPSTTTKLAKPAKPLHEPSKGPGGDQTDVLSNLPGSQKPGCVPVGKQSDVRSGDMGAGPFDAARKGYSAKNKAKQRVSLYFIPTHSAKLRNITVVGKNASTGASFTKTSKNVGDAEQWKFFQLDLTMPHAGKWTLKASTGQDYGCWVVNLA
jgi:hypothetical protein